MIWSPTSRGARCAIAALRKLGAKISKVELPDQNLVSAAALIVLWSRPPAPMRPWLRTRAADYGPQVRNRLQNGLAYGAVEYLEALRWRGPAGRSPGCDRRRRCRSRPGLARGGADHRRDRYRRAPDAEQAIRRSRALCGR
jgi:Asp-tRNA(Asn)/Glu-tRNA(Gln) amidotransferase A subunit family amidase